MKRRTFLRWMAIVPVIATNKAAAQDVGTGSATPVPISDAFRVTWWEIDASDINYPLFMGDVENLSDTTLDAPVVGITAYDNDGNILGSSYATPQPPVLEPGMRAYLYGAAPTDLPDDAVIELALCAEPSGMTSYTDETAALDLELEVQEEERGDASFHAVGMAKNNGATPASMVGVVALFSNPDRRVVGTLSTLLDRDIPARKSMRFEIDHGVRSYHSNHPFTDRLDPDYEVTYWCGYLPNARMIFC